MARGWIHTVQKDGQWMNEVEGQGAVRGKFRTKTEATAAGRERAKRDKTEHVIHKQDGTVGRRNSYGSDPRRSRG